MAKAKSSKPKSTKSIAKKRKHATTGKAPVKRADSKQQQLITMLQRPEGATIVELTKNLEWQPHTVRGAIAGALKKRLTLKVDSKKEDRGRVYRIMN
jgi:hypothetical protein